MSVLKRDRLFDRGVSRIFERGGPISIGSLKKRSSDFKRVGSKKGHQILKGWGPKV